MTTPTQADRDAATRWAKSNSRHVQAANIKRGSCDTAPLVQAFARHREQAERETVEKIVAWLYESGDPHKMDTADAIEAGEWKA
jgi:hypothetical protein